MVEKHTQSCNSASLLLNKDRLLGFSAQSHWPTVILPFLMKMRSVLINHCLLWREQRPADATNSHLSTPFWGVATWLHCTSNIQVEAGALIEQRCGLGDPLYPGSEIKAAAHAAVTGVAVSSHILSCLKPWDPFGALGSALAQCQLFGWHMHRHRFCADRLVIGSFRQLLRVSVCSLFSTAWKDVLILYVYRKCGKLSEHLLFINLAIALIRW